MADGFKVAVRDASLQSAFQPPAILGVRSAGPALRIYATAAATPLQQAAATFLFVRASYTFGDGGAEDAMALRELSELRAYSALTDCIAAAPPQHATWAPPRA